MPIRAIEQLRRILTRIAVDMPVKGRVMLVSALLLASPAVIQAQDEVTSTFDDLPQVRHLVAALSDPDSRTDTLFTMIVVARLLQDAPSLGPEDTEIAAQQFRDNRAWLDRLATRYLDLPMRSTVFDPAAWMIVRNLNRHGLEASSLVSPLGPDMEVLINQLFDRSDERLASAILPEVLVRIEYDAVALWRTLNESAANDEVLLAIIASLDEDWFDPWTAAEPPAPIGDDEDVLETMQEMLLALLDTATLAAPPDELSLKRIRYELLTEDSAEDADWDRESSYIIRLAAGIESLYERRYLSFTEALLWVVADLLHRASVEDAPPSPISAALAELLPRISNHYARDFARVDPRINAALAAAYDVVLNLQGESPGPDRINTLSLELADAVAQLVLTIPDSDFYFGQPVRNPIAAEIEICITIAAAEDQTGRRTMTRDQYDGCLTAMADLIDSHATSAELSGDMDGPFGAQQLSRELNLPPWQRINYVLGYLHESFDSICELPSESLPNPLEWATLATLMAWFAERAPVYFQTPENEAMVMRMRQHGLNLLQELSQQADCFSAAGGGLNDPVSRSLQNYDVALLELVAGVRESELAYREENLKAGADVVLSGDANQRTSYRSEGLMIGPCDVERTCGVNESLQSTRALVGLFPDAYLVADQSGLGRIEICYDNVEWLNRRSEPVRPEDPFVANYYGHLAFELKGRYIEGDESVDVFGSRFVSPEEYHYLFAAQDEEVLADSCPMERVGEKINATLDESRGLRIVPNRLTYLASARSRPSAVLVSNWDQGAEWRDWFVTGIGVTAMEFDGDPLIEDRVSQHLQSLYQAQQAMLYSALLRPVPGDQNSSGLDLYDLTQAVTSRKALIRSIINLFYPSLLLDSDSTRAALEGQAGLLDESILARFQDGNVPVASIGELGTERLQEFRADWGRLPDDVRRNGLVANSVAHALIRLNTIYQEFFGIQAQEPPSRAPRL